MPGTLKHLQLEKVPRRRRLQWHSRKVRSNGIGFWFGALIGISIVAIAWRMDDRTGRIKACAPLLAFGSFMICIGLAVLRSGYAWKNLAEGSRGCSRESSPGRYWASVLGHLLLGSGIIGYGVVLLLR